MPEPAVGKDFFMKPTSDLEKSPGRAQNTTREEKKGEVL